MALGDRAMELQQGPQTARFARNGLITLRKNADLP
jgi:hypothetical protein